MDAVFPTDAPALEIAEDRVWRLGASIALDGRVSWAPHMPGRFQPVNCYLVKEPGRVILIDTGLPAHRDTVVAQLQAILPAGLPLTSFMTRTELDCSGNVRAIHRVVGIDEMITGGGHNPFDAYDEVSSSVQLPMKRQKLAHTGDTAVPLGGSACVMMIPARIRILTTYWLYDTVSRTLFSSDLFGHTSISAPTARPILTAPDEDATEAVAKAHMLAKFGWLERADTRAIVSWLESVFSDFDVEKIAPTHGCILSGRSVVGRHRDALIRMLTAVGRNM